MVVHNATANDSLLGNALVTKEVIVSIPNRPYAAWMARSVGPLVKEWRQRRHLSQLDLAVGVGVSTRHLSFVETGRAKPSVELLITLATHLDVPLREQNQLLLAAGYAPRFTERSLEDSSMRTVRASIQRMLDAHQPYPGIVVDRQWNIVLTNAAALALVADLPEHLLTPPLNVFRLGLHPDGMWSRTTNGHEWAGYLLWQLRRTSALTGDPAVAALLQEVSAYPNIAADRRVAGTLDIEPPLLIAFEYDSPIGHLSLFTTLTTFGTPRDITLDELTIELFFPADDATESKLREGR